MKGQVQYEIYPTLPHKQLTVDEKILFDGLDIDPDGDQTGVTGDVGVAFTRAEHVLKRWREDIEQAVSEGEQYENYANIYLPNAKTEAEKIALTLVHFRKVDHNNLPKHSVLQKEKKSEEITRSIITSTQISEPIQIVTYLENNMEDLDSNSYNDSTASESVGGMAIKDDETTWTVVLKDKTKFTVTNEDLMDPSRFFVRRKCVSDDLNSIEKKKQ